MDFDGVAVDDTGRADAVTIDASGWGYLNEGKSTQH